jgi:hypothetical protein
MATVGWSRGGLPLNASSPSHVAEKVGNLTMNEQPTINHTKETSVIVDSHLTPNTAVVQGHEQNGNNLIIDFPVEYASAASTPASPTIVELGHP